MTDRNVTPEPERGPEERFSLYRLCECPECEGTGKHTFTLVAGEGEAAYPVRSTSERCPECRGEGRIRQELASCDSPEAVGVALVTLGREGEWEGCAFGLLDRMPECETCGGTGNADQCSCQYHKGQCPTCHGSGVKPTGTWILKPWLPSARNARDAARLLRSRRQ